MTVRANKPAFNIREKLKELDYSHIPYDKMPAGSVIQTVSFVLAAAQPNTTSSSLTPSGLKVTIYPHFSNSKIYVIANPVARAYNSAGANAEAVFAVYRNGTLIKRGQHRSYDYGNSGSILDVNIALTYLDSPNTTSSVEYEVYIALNAGTRVEINPSTSTDISTITVMEIRQ